MGMEPLGSLLSVQAQTMPNRSLTQSTEAKTTDNKDVMTEKAAYVDAATAPVTEKDGKNAQSNADTGEKEQQASSEKIKKAMEQLNKNMKHSEAIFGIHEETNRLTIKIVDRDSKELIKEFPPEKTLDMIAKVWELAGILVDEKR